MRFDAELENRYDSEAVVDYLEDWYHVPALVAVLAYMLWIRTRALEEFVRDGVVYFRGNDAYYHYRATTYSVQNWPRRLSADPWTHFPYGTTVGNFGSLMDQVVATVALVVGLGDPTARQVAIVSVVAPAVIGTLCLLLVYGIGTHLADSRVGGVVAAALLALVPSQTWVSRSTVGFYDHHVAEAFMMAATVLALLYAVRVARRERPVYEQVLDEDWEGLRPTLLASGLAGLVMGLYLHVWAPGLVLIVIVAFFTVIAAAVAVVRQESPEYLAFVGVAFGVVGAVSILPWAVGGGFSNANISWFQVVLLVGLAAGSAFLARLARYWDAESLEPTQYPIAVAGVGVLAFGVVWLVLPDVINSLLGGLDRVLLIEYNPTRGTVGEATPMDTDDIGSAFYRQYGFAFFTAFVGAAWMVGAAVLGQRSRPANLFVPVWSVVLLSMAITQVRFNYYLVLAVVVLNGWLVVKVLDLVDFPSLRAPERLETHHLLTVVTILLVLFLPLVVGGLSADVNQPTAAEQSQATGPGAVTDWKGNLDWMEENTPDPASSGGGDGSMSYYGPFDETDDYEYPEDAYGVMSWWDYGHWITVEGERIPNANPFQEGPRPASSFLQETDEDRANAYLDVLPVRGGVLSDLSDEELQELRDSRTEQEASEDTRYVMVDDQMAGGKFSPITEWAGPDITDYRETRTVQLGEDEQHRLPTMNERYEETMLSRLYHGDAGGLEHYRLVRESEQRSFIASAALEREGSYEPIFVNLDVRTIAQQFPGVYNAIRTGQIGDTAVELYDERQVASVKTFERVEGATLAGEADANEPVTAVVRLQTNTDRQFYYAQETEAGDDGSFELTVPYATDEQLGPENGYTDADVVANGTFAVYENATRSQVQQAEQFAQFGGGLSEHPSLGADAEATGVEVPETAIYEGDEIEVELEEVPDQGDGGNESEANGTASGSGTNGLVTGTGGSGDDGTDGAGDGGSGDGSGTTADEGDASAPVARIGG